MTAMPDRYRVAYNTTDGPIAVDEDGRQAQGRTWAAVDTRAPELDAPIARGALVYVDEPAPSDDPDKQPRLDPAAVIAFEQARQLNELDARAQVSPLDLDTLGAMTARRIVDHLADHPEDVDRVAALEEARPEPRSTVTDAVARIRAAGSEEDPTR